MQTQLSLQINLDSDFKFTNFYVEQPQEHFLIDQIKSLLVNPDILFIQGAPASGKTHLLRALCNRLESGEFLYVPAKKYSGLSVDILKINNEIKYIVVDDVDVLSGQSDWEQALFTLYNEVFDNQLGLLMSLTNHNKEFALADLQSRFSRVRRLELPGYDDDKKKQIFLIKAKSRGLAIDERVVDFINSRYSRNLSDMLCLLQKLDAYSMQYKNKITINSVKNILG